MTWDISVRLYHWLQLVCLIVLYISGTNGAMTIHLVAGLLLAALLIYRLLWAVFGPQPARLTGFIRRPSVAWKDLKDTLAGRATMHASHSPAGGYMVIALWLVLLTQLITGLLASDDFLFSAPLAGWVSFETSALITEWHRLLVNVLIGLVMIHVLAVLWAQLRLKHKIIEAMIHGRKTASTRLHIARGWQVAAIAIAIIISTWLYWYWKQNQFF